ncbi:MAG: hypothetical protein HY063_06380 [Bacteroidetes bacterium]|nr:hypothetical protein [Bacteroidota bacterium]
MITEEQKIEYQKTSKAALTVFLSVSAFVYSLAVAYCVLTKNFFAMSLVLAGVGIIALIVFLLFRKGF